MKAWETFNSNDPKRVIQQNDHHSHPKNEVKTQIKYNRGMLTILAGFISFMHSSIFQRKGNPSQLILMTTRREFLRDTDIVLSLFFLPQKTLAQALIVLSWRLKIYVMVFKPRFLNSNSGDRSENPVTFNPCWHNFTSVSTAVRVFSYS